MTNTEEREQGMVEDIPVKRNIHICLTKTTPSGYPIVTLKRQMTVLGLTCEETSQSMLEEYKQDVMKDFSTGERQVFHIAKGKVQSAYAMTNMMMAGFGNLNEVQKLERLGVSTVEANGSWVIDDDAAGYRVQLCQLIYADNFDKLQKEHADSFAGQKSTKSKEIDMPTGSVIRDTFHEIAMAACNTVKNGITPEDLESVISCIIGENTSDNPKDYQMDDVLLTYLVRGYEPRTQSASAVGVLAISYKVYIRDYKDKHGKKYYATMEATARFVSYSDIKDLERDISWLK